MSTYDYKDIEGSDKWVKVSFLEKGWSSDLKYLIETNSGSKFVLRIADISRYDEKKKEYEMIHKFSKLGFEMSMPIDFGICNENRNVYMILSWVDGVDLEEVLPNLEERQQYLLGRQAGEILKKLHSVEVEKEDIPVKTKIDKKLLQLENYEKSAVRVENDETAVQYVKNNINRIWSKSPVYLHGDFHPGNLIYMKNGSIGVIDFNRWEVGDPYEEFYKLESFGRDLSVPYCIGQIEAYFDDEIPDEFWKILAVYVAHASVYSIKWAEKFGQKDIENMTQICMRAFDDYENFERVIPKWYDKELKNKYRDGVDDGN